MTHEEMVDMLRNRVTLSSDLYNAMVNLLKNEIELKSELEIAEMDICGEVTYGSVGDGSSEPSEKSQELAFKRACDSIISYGASMHIDYSNLDDIVGKIIKYEFLKISALNEIG